MFDRAPFVTGLIQSLKLVRAWVGEGIVPTDTNYDSVKEKFKRGEVAYVLSGPWFSTDLEPGSFGISTLPQITEANGAYAKPFMTVEGLYMSRFSTRKAKAMQLIRFLASQTESNARKAATGDLVTRTDTGAALTESMRVFEAQLKHAQPTPNVPMMKSLWSPLNRVLAEVLKRQVEPEDAIREARLLIERGEARLEECYGRRLNRHHEHLLNRCRVCLDRTLCGRCRRANNYGAIRKAFSCGFFSIRH